MNPKQYKKKKIITDFVLINLVINGIFYVVNFRNFKGKLTIQAIATDLLIGLVLLGVLCTLIGFVNIRKDLRKGEVNLSDYQTSKVCRYFPQNTILRVLMLAVPTIFIVYLFFTAFPILLGFSEINHLVGFSFKTISAGLAAWIIGYFVLELSFMDYLVSTATDQLA